MTKAKRFKLSKVGVEGAELGTLTRIIIDTETGINYLFVTSGYAGGLTPLLDKDGKPIVTDIDGLDE